MFRVQKDMLINTLFVAQRTVVMSTLYTLLRLGGSKIIRKKDRFMLSKCVLSYVKKITLV